MHDIFEKEKSNISIFKDSLKDLSFNLNRLIDEVEFNGSFYHIKITPDSTLSHQDTNSLKHIFCTIWTTNSSVKENIFHEFDKNVFYTKMKVLRFTIDFQDNDKIIVKQNNGEKDHEVFNLTSKSLSHTDLIHIKYTCIEGAIAKAINALIPKMKQFSNIENEVIPLSYITKIDNDYDLNSFKELNNFIRNNANDDFLPMSYNLDLDLVFDILKVQKDGIALRLKKVFEPEYDILNNTVNPSVSYVNFFLSNEGKIYTALHNEFFNISRYDHECFYEVLNTTTNNILEYSKDQNYIKLTSNTNRMKPVSISFYPKQLKNIFLELIDNLNNL